MFRNNLSELLLVYSRDLNCYSNLQVKVEFAPNSYSVEDRCDLSVLRPVEYLISCVRKGVATYLLLLISHVSLVLGIADI